MKIIFDFRTSLMFDFSIPDLLGNYSNHFDCHFWNCNLLLERAGLWEWFSVLSEMGSWYWMVSDPGCGSPSACWSPNRAVVLLCEEKASGCFQAYFRLGAW